MSNSKHVWWMARACSSGYRNFVYFWHQLRHAPGWWSRSENSVSRHASLVAAPGMGMLHPNYSPKKLTYPLKLNGWKMKFPFEMVPFLGHLFIFGGITLGSKCFLANRSQPHLTWTFSLCQIGIGKDDHVKPDIQRWIEYESKATPSTIIQVSQSQSYYKLSSFYVAICLCSQILMLFGTRLKTHSLIWAKVADASTPEHWSPEQGCFRKLAPHLTMSNRKILLEQLSIISEESSLFTL